MAQDVLLQGTYKIRTKLLVEAKDSALENGNTTAVPSAKVLTNAAAEARARERYSAKPMEDLKIMKSI